MLAEAIVYLASVGRTPPRFRRHLVEAVGLWSRGKRQAAAWSPHIANTRGLIDSTIDEIAPRRGVAILGSGPLFDVPLEALARTFEAVWLIDRSHLATTRRRIQRYSNVHESWQDLSATAGRRPLDFLGEIADLDWVVSVNLLSQLARAAPDGGERHEIAAHLDGLAALPFRTTLVTDIDYRVLDRAGTVREAVDLLHGHVMPEPDLTWKWEVAPFGEETRDARRVHQVAAWSDWRGGD